MALILGLYLKLDVLVAIKAAAVQSGADGEVGLVGGDSEGVHVVPIVYAVVVVVAVPQVGDVIAVGVLGNGRTCRRQPFCRVIQTILVGVVL